MPRFKFEFENTAGFKKSDVSDAASQLHDYISSLRRIREKEAYQVPESFLTLPFDKKPSKEIETVLEKKISSELKYAILFGIGGSILGAQAVEYALRDFRKTPKLLSFDAIDERKIEELVWLIEQNIKDPREILIIFSSRSGTPIEPIVNFEAFLALIRTKLQGIEDRIIVVSAEGTNLLRIAQEKSIPTVAIPDIITSRYSIFSSIDLLPLQAVGVDVEGLRKGAKEVTEQCLSEDIRENPALASAVLMYLHFNAGRAIHPTLFFNLELEKIGTWYRQLLGESIGKEKKGITPLVSTSNDLHILLQLYFGGPDDKFTTLVHVKKSRSLRVPDEPYLKDLAPEIEHKSTQDILHAIVGGVRASYRHHGRPHTYLELPDLSPQSIGAYLQLKMFETIFLAKLLNVNPFDQPDVEDYKQQTRKILGS